MRSCFLGFIFNVIIILKDWFWELWYVVKAGVNKLSLKQVREGQSTVSLFASSWNSGTKQFSHHRKTSVLARVLVGKYLTVTVFLFVPYVYQSYDSKFLKIYPELEPTPLQLEEDLEQLKVLENGYKMKV